MPSNPEQKHPPRAPYVEEMFIDRLIIGYYRRKMEVMMFWRGDQMVGDVILTFVPDGPERHLADEKPAEIRVNACYVDFGISLLRKK